MWAEALRPVWAVYAAWATSTRSTPAVDLALFPASARPQARGDVTLWVEEGGSYATGVGRSLLLKPPWARIDADGLSTRFMDGEAERCAGADCGSDGGDRDPARSSNARRPGHARRPSTAPSARAWPPDSITLCSHLTVDRLATFVRDVIPAWDGPISLVVYLTSAVDEAELHRVLDASTFRALEPHALEVVRPALNTAEERRAALRYPINGLRNRALQNAPTEFVLSLDADFIPSPAAHETLARWSVPLLEAAQRRTAVVVSCFALAPVNTSAPQSWRELRKAFAVGTVSLTDAIAGHGPTRPSVGFGNGATSAETAHYGIGYETQMEPYVLMRRSEHPLYDERFTDQGGDKQEHSLLLNALGTDFVVAREVWAMHPASAAKAPWPVDRARAQGFDEADHFSSAQRDETRFRYFQDYVPQLERAVGGATRLRYPAGRSAADAGVDRSFGRPGPGLLFGM